MTTTVTTQPITRTRQLTVDDLKSLPIQMKLEDGFLILEKSLKGHPLKNQVKVPMVQILNTGQKGLVEYIINSL